jgi:hypothetical protein
MFNKLFCSLMSAKTAFVNRLREEKGSHIVEIVIFIAIAVGLAFIFKDKIAALLDQIFNVSTEAVDTLSGP